MQSNFNVFVTKFCYDYLSDKEQTVGKVRLQLQRVAPERGAMPQPVAGRLLFLIFDDEKTHWKLVRKRWETSSCEEKQAAASNALEVKIEPNRTEATYQVQIGEHVRPRFWYFGLAGCDLRFTEPVRFRVHMKNDIWGWQSEFSLDHMGLFILYAVFTFAFGLATAATAYGSRSIGDHPYIKLLLLSYGSSLASCWLFLGHYTLFLRDGSGSKRIRFVAVVASTVANCTIFLIAILCSVGWAITKFNMPNRRCFLGMTALVGGLSALSELRAETMVDQSTKLYSYQSGPGVLALVLKIFIFCWFAYQTKQTYDEERDGRLRRYYKYLGISITGWSLNVPVTVLLAFKLSPWVRYKTVITIELVARLLGQVLLSQLFCGPLSPITAANTFLPGRAIPLQTHFSQLDDGQG